MSATMSTQTETFTVKRYLEITTDSKFLSWKWKTKGACVGAVKSGEYKAMEWFPVDQRPTVRVKAVCMSCPVRLECLAMAIYTNEQDGVWGGQGAKTIRRMRRKIMSALKTRMPRSNVI